MQTPGSVRCSPPNPVHTRTHAYRHVDQACACTTGCMSLRVHPKQLRQHAGIRGTSTGMDQAGIHTCSTQQWQEKLMRGHLGTDIQLHSTWVQGVRLIQQIQQGHQPPCLLRNVTSKEVRAKMLPGVAHSVLLSENCDASTCHSRRNKTRLVLGGMTKCMMGGPYINGYAAGHMLGQGHASSQVSSIRHPQYMKRAAKRQLITGIHGVHCGICGV